MGHFVIVKYFFYDYKRYTHKISFEKFTPTPILSLWLEWIEM